MKDKRQTPSDVIKGLIKTSGDVVDKALDKSSDLATAMMDQTAKLISKLSDDIGAMADRILTMEERIGFMADRIVKTEELMAKLTAKLANKELALSASSPMGDRHPPTPVLEIAREAPSPETAPVLRISDDPKVFLLYVSTSPRFAEGGTVVSRVTGPEELEAAWRRSLSALVEMQEDSSGQQASAMVSIAVKIVDNGRQTSPLSNSIDVTVGG